MRSPVATVPLPGRLMNATVLAALGVPSRQPPAAASTRASPRPPRTQAPNTAPNQRPWRPAHQPRPAHHTTLRRCESGPGHTTQGYKKQKKRVRPGSPNPSPCPHGCLRLLHVPAPRGPPLFPGRGEVLEGGEGVVPPWLTPAHQGRVGGQRGRAPWFKQGRRPADGPVGEEFAGAPHSEIDLEEEGLPCSSGSVVNQW